MCEHKYNENDENKASKIQISESEYIHSVQ